jgi:hypothetical protein
VLPDPRWLQILRATRPQTTAVALACGCFLLAAHAGSMPPLDPWVLQAVAFLFLISWALTSTSMANSASKIFPLPDAAVNIMMRRLVIPVTVTLWDQTTIYLAEIDPVWKTVAMIAGGFVTLLTFFGLWARRKN